MQPVIRAKINKYGFCPEHFIKLYKEGQKLSVALLAHSHFITLKEEVAGYERKILQSFQKKKFPGNGERKSFRNPLEKYCEKLQTQRTSCALCNKSQHALKRYTYTIIYLWKKKSEFKEIYEGSRGFCYTHLPLVLEMAAHTLRGESRRLFFEDLFKRQEQNAQRMEEEIDWFIRKYDYRNRDQSWKTSKDALPRILQRILGVVPRE